MKAFELSEWQAFYQQQIQPRYPYDLQDMGRRDMLNEVDDWLDAHTIDAVPVVHGRWFLHRLSVPKGRGQTYSVYGCSKCHKHEKKRTAYCPNCGAKMLEHVGTEIK